MNVIENDRYILNIESGIIKEFYDKQDETHTNLAGTLNKFGSVSYTLMSEDITKQKVRVGASPYLDRTSIGEEILRDSNSVNCEDKENKIRTQYLLDEGLTIEVSTENKEISQFGVNIELNFLGKLGTSYANQIMPTSPYSGIDRRYHYCIMTRPNGQFIVCLALTECDGWKIDYSEACWGHYIENFKFLASFDKAYQGSMRKSIKVNIHCAASLEEVYEIIHTTFKVPYCQLVVSGNFGGEPVVRVSEDTDRIEVVQPDGGRHTVDMGHRKIYQIEGTQYGFYSVIPYAGQTKGMDAVIWYCDDMKTLFDLSCKAIRKPYHCDDNLCEGGIFLWSMFANMRVCGHRFYDEIAREELSIIMGDNGANVEGKTILPYKTEQYEAYHVSDSKRVQEQFFGVSILMEAYKLYDERNYLEFGIAALYELVNNWITEEGMIFNGEDYTTVCAPLIVIVDMAKLLKMRQDSRAKDFEKAAIKVADFLVKRGLNFPTEGTGEDTESDAEDGSVSCTALSLLYICKELHYDKRYMELAERVLQLHNAWTIFTPDARMYGSSFRWWESMFEGDGEGPAICAGHAWTIWKAEALYLYGMLTYDEEALLLSWNGFMSNFAKCMEDGTMYTCFEVDYIRGGGFDEIKAGLRQLEGEDKSVKFKIAHSYPEHIDSSLSRYAWVRNVYSWWHTAAVLEREDKLFVINGKAEGNEFIVPEQIDSIFVGVTEKTIVFKCDRQVKIVSAMNLNIICGMKDGEYTIPQNGKITIHKV